ncbi:hypothetical protein COU38_01775 [Candidatus Micrarchaeota archaeon CG10_big_fil_rev_8_21_14_0_10_54_18]|nr:MAG: hypothetical protein COU38_01775 [Candidatus Micrarchaeota archaeon CG10_big_fil_rev_8_21_14_0_10_54_18]
MRTDFDAIVVGGGPAGTSFARKAAEGGMNVLVIEKKKDFGVPVRCGEGFSERWNQVLEMNVSDADLGARMKGAAVFAPNGKKIVLVNDQTTGYVLERKMFDKRLALEAGRAGATLLPKSLAIGLVKEGNKTTGLRALHEGVEKVFKAPLIVSAEGMEAKIAREAGFDCKYDPYDVDACVEYEMVGVKCEPLIALWFGNEIAPRGYVWVFPKGVDYANVGIGVGGSTGADPKKLLDDFIGNHPEFFGDATVVEVKGGVISVGAPIKKMTSDGFMVIGTAAHQVDPIHGGGIGLAIEAGLIAAKHALKAFESGDYSDAALSGYEKEWRGLEEEKLGKRLKLRHVIEKLSDDDFNHVFNETRSKDLDEVLNGHFQGLAARIVLKRPSLLKVLKVLI